MTFDSCSASIKDGLSLKLTFKRPINQLYVSLLLLMLTSPWLEVENPKVQATLHTIKNDSFEMYGKPFEFDLCNYITSKGKVDVRSAFIFQTLKTLVGSHAKACPLSGEISISNAKVGNLYFVFTPPNHYRLNITSLDGDGNYLSMLLYFVIKEE
jgi:hypothetical protein